MVWHLQTVTPEDLDTMTEQVRDCVRPSLSLSLHELPALPADKRVDSSLLTFIVVAMIHNITPSYLSPLSPRPPPPPPPLPPLRRQIRAVSQSSVAPSQTVRASEAGVELEIQNLYLTAGTYTVGRKDCQICVTGDSAVSRRHAEFVVSTKVRA